MQSDLLGKEGGKGGSVLRDKGAGLGHEVGGEGGEECVFFGIWWYRRDVDRVLGTGLGGQGNGEGVHIHEIWRRLWRLWRLWRRRLLVLGMLP